MSHPVEIVAEVVSALAAFGALVAAVRAGITASRLYDIEVRRDVLRDRATARDQASRVNAWIGVVADPDRTRLGVVVSNVSSSPVYGVTAWVDGFGRLDAPHLSTLPPGDYFVEQQPGRFPWAFAAPAAEFGDRLRPYTARGRKDGTSYAVTSLTFRDRAGVVWSRNATGELEPDDDRVAA